MSRWAARLPSVGFVTVILVNSLALAFFLWGFSTPDLDRVWTLHHELKIGSMEGLSRSDRELLNRALARWPRLARSLLDERDIGLISEHSDGWIDTPTAVVLRTPQSRRFRFLVLDVQTAADLMPCSMVVSGERWKRKKRLSEHQRLEIELPEAPGHPEVITVALRGRSLPSDASALGLRIRFSDSREIEQ
jgi:hypothetical protein